MTLSQLHTARHALLRCIKASPVTDFRLIAEYGNILVEISKIENPLRELKVA